MNRDQWQEIWVVLSRNKLRTFLTAFGVFWGIFMLVIMLGSGKGLENGAMANFGNRVKNSVFMWAQTTSKPYKGFSRGRRPQLKVSDVQAIKNEVGSVGLISPRCQAGGHRGSDNVTRGTKTGAFSIYGDTPTYIKIEPVNILKGRYINQTDIEEYRKVCFIGKEVYNALYNPGEEVIGSYVMAQGINYKVVGMYASTSTNPQTAERQEKAMITPISTFQRAYNWGENIGWLSITSQKGIPASTMEQEVKEVLKKRHKVHPEDDRAFGSFNLEEQFNRMNNLITGIQLLSLIVGTLTLFAGAVGVSNIMIVTVKERTREFGIRRAIGAQPWSIISQVLSEAVILTVLSGMAGIILGVWALEGVASLMNSMQQNGEFFRNPGVNLPIVLIALGLLIGAGILAGLIPARRAVEVKPVDAIRYE